MIQFSCPQCGHTMKVPPAAAGKRGKCKKCGEVIQVPRQNQGQSAVEQDDFDEFDRPQRKRSTSQPKRDKNRKSSKKKKGQPISNILGIVGIVMGVGALAVSWLPSVSLFVSLPLGAIGLILAIVGLVKANSEKRPSYGIPIGAGAVNAIALVAVLVMTVFVGSTDKGTMASNQPTVQQKPTPKKKERENPAAEEVVVANAEKTSTSEETTSAEATKPEETTPSETPKEEVATKEEEAKPDPNVSTVMDAPWEDARETYDGEFARVSITGAKMEKIEQWIKDNQVFTEEPMLSIRVSLKNKQQKERMEFSGWGKRGNARLQDENGKVYKPEVFTHPLHPVFVQGQASNEDRLKPNAGASDRLVFKAPDASVKQLRLVLPAYNFGIDGEVHLVYDTSKIEQ